MKECASLNLARLLFRKGVLLLAAMLAWSVWGMILPASAAAGFAEVCGMQLCMDGQVFTIHGATAYGHYNDPAIFAAARDANINVLELVEFDNHYHRLSDTMSPGTWNRVDRFIAAAGKNGLHVILNTSEFGQSLKAAGQSAIDVAQWKKYLYFVVGRTNSITGVRYADDPTILMINLYGEIDPDPGVTSFYRQTLAYLKSIDPHHLHSTGGFSQLNWPSGLDRQWKAIMSDPNNDICEFEINSKGDRNITAPQITAYCQAVNKPWFLAAWSSCTPGTGGGDLDNWGSDAQMAAHAQDMYDIANGAIPAAGRSVGADFWNFSGATGSGCDIGYGNTPQTYAVVKESGRY